MKRSSSEGRPGFSSLCWNLSGSLGREGVCVRASYTCIMPGPGTERVSTQGMGLCVCVCVFNTCLTKGSLVPWAEGGGVGIY